MKPILESKFLVPACLVPLDVLSKFQIVIKPNKDAEPENTSFYEYNNITDYYEFARGNIGLIEKSFGIEYEDKRVNTPMSCVGVSTSIGYGLQFTGKLRPNQQVVADFFLKPNNAWGQLKANPRFGKTVTMTYLTCKWGLKTLFLSHQVDLSKQALNTFYRDTNIFEIEHILGKQIIGIVDEWDDLDKYDVAFMPYQRFVSGTNAEENLSKYKNRFGTVLVDECHKMANTGFYPRTVSSFNAKNRIGVSGTTEIKSGLHVINDYIIGPVRIEGESLQIPVEVIVKKTNVRVPVNAINMNIFRVKAYKYLSKSQERNMMIVRDIVSWANAGHFCIAVTEFTEHIEEIVKLLKCEGIKAEAYHGKKFKNEKLREECLNKMRNGESQVFVANRTMTLGLDIPRLTAFFNMLPIANGPTYYQEVCRIRTPFEGKYLSWVTDYVDDHYILNGFFKARLKMYNEKDMKIIVNET